MRLVAGLAVRWPVLFRGLVRFILTIFAGIPVSLIFPLLPLLPATPLRVYWQGNPQSQRKCQPEPRDLGPAWTHYMLSGAGFASGCCCCRDRSVSGSKFAITS